MRKVEFSEEDIVVIKIERYHHLLPRVQQRMEVLWLKSRGLTHEKIAELAGVSRRTVQRIIAAYLEGGLDQVRRMNFHQQKSKLMDYFGSLEDHFLENPPASVAQAQADIFRLTGIWRSLTQVRTFLKKCLNLRPLKVGAIPSKADAQKQEEFLEKELQPRLDEAKAGKRTVFFVDAAHFCYAPFLGVLWCVMRLFVPAPAGRSRYNVLAALHATTHEVVTVCNGTYINAISVCELMREIAAAGYEGPITLVLDNARYQRCALVQSLARTLNIELLFLPSYSPNLNLIERLWKFVKRRCLASRWLATFDEFKSQIDCCLSSLTNVHKKELDTLLSLKFQSFENVPILAA